MCLPYPRDEQLVSKSHLLNSARNIALVKNIFSNICHSQLGIIYFAQIFSNELKVFTF